MMQNQRQKPIEAVMKIGRYLLTTKDKGLMMKPYDSGVECWADAAYASEWSNKLIPIQQGQG
jgi:hypothetical protein